LHRGWPQAKKPLLIISVTALFWRLLVNDLEKIKYRSTVYTGMGYDLFLLLSFDATV
jgi:hypothetical protein